MIALGSMFYSSMSATCDYAQAAFVHVMENESKQSSILMGPLPRSEIPVLIRTAADYTDAIARVLPINEEADRLVAPLFSGHERRSKIRRR